MRVFRGSFRPLTIVLFVALACALGFLGTVKIYGHNLDTCYQLRKAGDYEGAIASCNRALHFSLFLRSRTATALTQRAAAYDAQGNYDKAMADAYQAITLAPGDMLTYHFLGIIFYDKGKYAAAVAAYNVAIALHANNFIDLYNRGMARLEIGDYEHAIADFSEVIRLQPNDWKAYFARGFVRADRGDIAGAIPDEERAVALNPKDPGAQGNLCWDLARTRRPLEALPHCDNAVALDSRDAGLREFRAYAQISLRNWPKALDDLAVMLSSNPKRVEDALFMRGYVHERLGDITAAQADYASARQANRHIDDIMSTLGIIPGNSDVKPSL
jgi:tetratricopeptide (TPR) repeat protein